MDTDNALFEYGSIPDTLSVTSKKTSTPSSVKELIINNLEMVQEEDRASKTLTNWTLVIMLTFMAIGV